MKAEKVILSFIALFVGLIVAGIAFYLYQGTKTITPTQVRVTKQLTPTPTANPSLALTITSPTDEAIFDKKTITVAGHTQPDSLVVISNASGDEVVTPASNGNFNTTITIDDDQNLLEITAIAPNGSETTIQKVVTFSTETF